MHELLLFGQVPSTKHALVVSALAGLTALQPQPLAERHLLFRPKRDPGTPSDQALSKKLEQYNVPKSFRTDTYYVQAVGNLAVPPRQQQQQQQQTSQDLRAGGSSQRTGGNGLGAGVTAADGMSSTVDPSRQAKGEVGRGTALANENGADAMMIDNDSSAATAHSASGVTEAHTTDEQQLPPSSTATATTVVPGGSDFVIYPWEIEFRDLLTPIAGSDKTTKRITFDKEIGPGQSPADFLEELGYRFVNEHMLQGHRFSHGNIDLRLFRGYGLAVPASDVPRPNPSAPIASVPFDPQSVAGGQQPPLQLQQLQRPASVPGSSAGSGNGGGSDGGGQGILFSALDPSGAYLLEARLLVDVDNDPKITKQGQEEMERLKEQLRGLVDLEMAPRLAMNTRIR